MSFHWICAKLHSAERFDVWIAPVGWRLCKWTWYWITVDGKSLFLMSHVFAGPVQRIFNCDQIQYSGLTSDNVLNLLMYRSPFCVIVYTSYKLWKMVSFFLVRSIYTVFQKSDAKIQITITTAYLIRIKYPLTNFNHHLSYINFASFNKIHCTVSEQQLF